MAALRLVTAPAIEPVTLTEAKTHLRVDSSDEDAYISALITAAREIVERIHLWRALITQTWEYVLDDWPDEDVIKIPYPPLQSIVSITYTDEDGNDHTLSTDVYAVDTYSEPGRVVLKPGQTWPTADLWPAGAIRIQFVAGYGDNASDIPQPIRQAILLLVGHLYENREATGKAAQEIPLGISAMMAGYQAKRFC